MSPRIRTGQGKCLPYPSIELNFSRYSLNTISLRFLVRGGHYAQVVDIQGAFTPPYHESREGEARRGNVVCSATPPISDAFLGLRESQHLTGENLCSIVGTQGSVGEDRLGTGHSILCNATRGSCRRSLDKVKMKLLSMDIQNAYGPVSWPRREKF